MFPALNVYSYSKMRRGTEVMRNQEGHTVLTELTTRVNVRSVCEAKDMPSGHQFLATFIFNFLSLSMYCIIPLDAFVGLSHCYITLKTSFAICCFFVAFGGADDVKYRILCSKRCAKH